MRLDLLSLKELCLYIYIHTIYIYTEYSILIDIYIYIHAYCIYIYNTYRTHIYIHTCMHTNSNANTNANANAKYNIRHSNTNTIQYNTDTIQYNAIHWSRHQWLHAPSAPSAPGTLSTASSQRNLQSRITAALYISISISIYEPGPWIATPPPPMLCPLPSSPTNLTSASYLQHLGATTSSLDPV